MKHLTALFLMVTALSTPVRVGVSAPTLPAEAGWAVDRFAAAGLELPPVAFEFHRGDRTPCAGNTAVAAHGGAVDTVIVCADAGAADVVVRRALLHELAHVWAHRALTEETRAAFVSARGTSSWSEAETPWSERGSEQAAEIITWALMDRELSMVTLADHDPEGLAAGYRLLTGRVPPPR